MMSAETHTPAATPAAKGATYHGSRRNALGDIFEHVDVTQVSKLRQQCPHPSGPHPSSNASCCRSCLTPCNPRRRSAAADLSPDIATTTDTSISCVTDDSDLRCSRRVEEDGGSSVGPAQAGEDRTTGSCLSLTVRPEIGSTRSAGSNSHPHSDTATTTESEKKSLTANGATCSDQSENFHCIAGFRPKDCAKRSLVF